MRDLNIMSFLSRALSTFHFPLAETHRRYPANHLKSVSRWPFSSCTAVLWTTQTLGVPYSVLHTHRNTNAGFCHDHLLLDPGYHKVSR